MIDKRPKVPLDESDIKAEDKILDNLNRQKNSHTYYVLSKEEILDQGQRITPNWQELEGNGYLLMDQFSKSLLKRKRGETFEAEFE